MKKHNVTASLLILTFLCMVALINSNVLQRTYAQEELPQYGTLYSVQWSPDGSKLLAGEYNGQVIVWDALSGVELYRFGEHRAKGLEGGRGRWSPDGTRIVTWSANFTARLWDSESGLLLQTFAGHTEDITTVYFSPDGGRLLTLCEDSTARIWDINSGALLLTYTGHTGITLDAQWTRDGTRIATGSADATTRIWDTATGQTLLVLADREPNALMVSSGVQAEIWGVSFSPDERQIVATGMDGLAIVYDVASGAVLHKLYISTQGTTYPDLVWDSYWSPDSTRILVQAVQTPPSVWDAATGELQLVLQGHTDIVSRTRWSVDGARIMTSSLDGMLRFWDAVTGESQTIDTQEAINSAEYSPDGALIGTTSSSGTIRLWDAVSGDEIQFIFPLASGAIQSPSFAQTATALALDISATTVAVCLDMSALTGEATAGGNTVLTCNDVPLTWQYTGVASETLTLTLQASSQGIASSSANVPMTMQVYSPDGSVLGETTTGSLAIELPLNGRYRIQVTPPQSDESFIYYTGVLTVETSRP